MDMCNVVVFSAVTFLFGIPDARVSYCWFPCWYPKNKDCAIPGPPKGAVVWDRPLLEPL